MKKKAFIYIILAGILWGTSAIFVHFLSPFGFSSLQMTLIRGLTAFALLLAYILFRDKTLFRLKPAELLVFLGIGIAFFGTASCYFASMQMTSVSTAVILMYTAPILVMLYSVLFLGEKLTPLKTVSVAAMLVGCALVSGIIGGLKFDPLGIAIGFLSGISYAAYNILTKIAMRRSCNPFTTTVYCFLFSTIIALFVCEPKSIPEAIGKMPAVTIPVALLMGICTCFLPYILYTKAMKTLPAGTATSLGIIEPMSATLFSVIFLGEPLSVPTFCGIILILASVFLLSKSEN